MRISDQTIEEIKQAADILEVIEDFLPLKKKGSSWWALSPFTNEKTPSFSVSPAKGIFKCFSTGKGGDSISFIMEMEGVGYLEALRYLANKYGIEIAETEQTPAEKEAQTVKESLYAALSFASNYFQELLHKADEGRSVGLSYFKQRGFLDHTINSFELGYSLDQWNAFEDHAIKHGFKPEILDQAGLVVYKEGNKRYDRFRGRVMFPIQNVSGRVIGFGARTLKADRQAKYLNSPESEVYHKSDVLYGIYQAKKEIRNQDNCYLVEGYTDVISLHQAGVINVAASSGTSLTESQIRLIKRFTHNVTVLYDGDAAGIKAAMRGVDMLLEQDLNVRVVQFPNGEDPDSYVRKVGGTAFKEFLQKEAKDFILFKTQLFIDESANDPIKKGEAIRDIVESISKVPDPIKRTVFYQQSSQLLGMSEEMLVEEGNRLMAESLRRKQKQESYQRKKSAPALPPPSNLQPEDLDGMVFSEGQEEDWQLPTGEVAPADSQWAPAEEGSSLPAPAFQVSPAQQVINLQEKETIRLLLLYGKATIDDKKYVADYILEEVGEVEFQHPVYKKMLTTFQEASAKGRALDMSDFFRSEEEEVRNEASGLVSNKHELSDNWWERHQIIVPPVDDDLAKMAYQNLIRLKFRVIKQLEAQAQDNLKNAKTVADEIEMQELCLALAMQRIALAKLINMN